MGSFSMHAAIILHASTQPRKMTVEAKSGPTSKVAPPTDGMEAQKRADKVHDLVSSALALCAPGRDGNCTASPAQAAQASRLLARAEWSAH